jgi:hypothetical protein
MIRTIAAPKQLRARFSANLIMVTIVRMARLTMAQKTVSLRASCQIRDVGSPERDSYLQFAKRQIGVLNPENDLVVTGLIRFRSQDPPSLRQSIQERVTDIGNSGV